MENESEHAVINALAEVLRIFAARGRALREERARATVLPGEKAQGNEVEIDDREGGPQPGGATGAGKVEQE